MEKRIEESPSLCSHRRGRFLSNDNHIAASILASGFTLQFYAVEEIRDGTPEVNRRSQLLQFNPSRYRSCTNHSFSAGSASAISAIPFFQA